MIAELTHLTYSEYVLYKYLYIRMNTFVDAEELITKALGQHVVDRSARRTMQVQMCSLRKKLPFDLRIICKHKIGYMMEKK